MACSSPPNFSKTYSRPYSHAEVVLNTAASLLTNTQIDAEVPLSEMFGYATDLRSQTQGRASYSMEPLKYAEAPTSVAAAVIEARKK